MIDITVLLRRLPDNRNSLLSFLCTAWLFHCALYNVCFFATLFSYGIYVMTALVSPCHGHVSEEMSVLFCQSIGLRVEEKSSFVTFTSQFALVIIIVNCCIENVRSLEHCGLAPIEHTQE